MLRVYPISAEPYAGFETGRQTYIAEQISHAGLPFEERQLLMVVEVFRWPLTDECGHAVGIDDRWLGIRILASRAHRRDLEYHVACPGRDVLDVLRERFGGHPDYMTWRRAERWWDGTRWVAERPSLIPAVSDTN